MIPYLWLEEAAKRIDPYIQKTPLTYDNELSLYLKWENHQVTGSFKARGALNKVLCLQPWELQEGLVAASAGNHGQGVALAARLVGAPVVVFCPGQAVAAKVVAMKALGADVRLVPGGYGEAELAGRDYAAERGAMWISPYNDGQVIAGQGTLGLEVAAELPEVQSRVWIVPVGGGGLIAGIGASLQKHDPRPRLVGVQSTASPFFYKIYSQGDQNGVVESPSLADGLAGPVEENAVTIPMVKRLVDDFILVSEEDIAEAIAYAWERYHERIEGSAATALAVALTGKVADRPAVVVLSGGNIQPEVHAQILAKQRYSPKRED